jgi:GNAT superfamily N-acetyltransferase
MEWQSGAFTISTDKARLDRAMICEFLASSYWAKSTPRERILKSIETSLTWGLFEGGRQIGYARAFSDFCRNAFLSDVFVVPEYRGRGLGQWLVETVLAHPELAGVRWLLRTADAHGLYEKFGFERSEPEMTMIRRS